MSTDMATGILLGMVAMYVLDRYLIVAWVRLRADR